MVFAGDLREFVVQIVPLRHLQLVDVGVGLRKLDRVPDGLSLLIIAVTVCLRRLRGRQQGKIKTSAYEKTR